MSTFEKAIQKLRKLSHQFELTHNSTEIHSNASFFEEERSQDFQDSDLSLPEDLQDNWEMSSICTENSIIPPQSIENITNLNNCSHPQQTPVRGQFAEERIASYVKGINNNNSQTGKGIAIHVLGQGSIGTVQLLIYLHILIQYNVTQKQFQLSKINIQLTYFLYSQYFLQNKQERKKIRKKQQKINPESQQSNQYQQQYFIELTIVVLKFKFFLIKHFLIEQINLLELKSYISISYGRK